jgi:WD40 repeat protein
VLLWDAASGAKRATLVEYTGAVAAVRFHPCKPLLASADGAGVVRLWDVSSGSYLRDTLKSDRGGITALAWSPDGKFLVTGTDQGAAVLWAPAEARDRQEVALLSPFRVRVSSVAFSSDGRSVAVGVGRAADANGVVALWDLSRLTAK